MEISIFNNINHFKDGAIITIENFIQNVKNGIWKEKVLEIRNEPDKPKRNDLKKKLPYVTPSGLFGTRSINGLITHSKFICIDIDNIDDIDQAFYTIKNDPYTYCVFRSVSGNGLAVLIKIDPNKHLESFEGIEKYYCDKYNLFVDKVCKDVSRARLVSYDPDLYINTNSPIFKSYAIKKINPRKVPVVISGKNDFDFIIDQINTQNIDLTGSEYSKFLHIGFALSSEFGENGRDHFHVICSKSQKYSYEVCEKQYNHCLRSNNSGINIGTFYYYAKEAGISLITPQTKQIISSALISKKAGKSIDETIDIISKVDGIEKSESFEIISKIYSSNNVNITNDLPKINQIEFFINSNYDLKKNQVTRKIENNGIEIDTPFLNSVYLKARKECDDKIKFDEIDRLINSDFTEIYNPLVEWFTSREHIEIERDYINDLCNTIESDGSSYKNEFIKKWLIGIVASAFGNHSPLLLVLTGVQNTGKTEWFRRLLPDKLKTYYAESKLDSEKDSEILMTQKLLIVDDEFGGKSKFESKRLKELTSKQYFNLREPYGRTNVTLKRISVLAGTSNDDEILSDSTGNRRIIPIKVNLIDHNAFNDIDKEKLFIQIYKEYKQGENWNLNKDEIKFLNDSTKEFEQISIERELICKFFKSAENKQGYEAETYLQASEIKTYIEQKTNQRLNIYKMGQEMKKLGFISISKRIDGISRRVYILIIKENETISDFTDSNSNEGMNDIPF